MFQIRTRHLAALSALVLTSCKDPSLRPQTRESPWTGAEDCGKLPGKVLILPPSHVAHTGDRTSWTTFMLDPIRKEDRLTSAPVSTHVQSESNVTVYDWDGSPGGGSSTVNKYGPISVKYFAELKTIKDQELPADQVIQATCTLIHKHFGDYHLGTAQWLSELGRTAQIINELNKEIDKLPVLENGKIVPKDLENFVEGLGTQDYFPLEYIRRLTGYDQPGTILKAFPKTVLDLINISIPKSLTAASDLNVGTALVNWARLHDLIDDMRYVQIMSDEGGHRSEALREIAKGRILTEMLLEHAKQTSIEHLEKVRNEKPNNLSDKTNNDVDKVGYGNQICSTFAPILKDSLTYLGIQSFLVYGRLDPDISQPGIYHLFVYIPAIHCIGEATTKGRASLQKVTKVSWDEKPLCTTAGGKYEFIRLIFDSSDTGLKDQVLNSSAMRMLLKQGETPTFWNRHSLLYFNGGLYVVPNAERDKVKKHPVVKNLAIWSALESEGEATLRPSDDFYLAPPKPRGLFWEFK